MKTRIIVASASLSILCVVYLGCLLDAADAVSTTRPTVVSGPFLNATNIPEAQQAVTTSKEMARLKTTRSVLTLKNSVGGRLECKKGTQLFFQNDSFVDANGKTVSGEVKLVVEECYDLDEIAAAKLTTMAGSRRLETAGMVNLRASHKGKEVFLRADKRYNIYFPLSTERREDFELFYGAWKENGLIDWKLEPSSEPIAEIASESNARSIRNDCFIQISESEFRCGTRIKKMDYFNWPLSNGQSLNQWFVSNFNPDPAMLDDFCANKMFAEITFRIKEDGSFKDYYVSHTAQENYDRVLAETLSAMPSLDMKKFMPKYNQDHACVLSFGRQQGSDSKNFVESFVKKFDYADDEKKLTGVNPEDLNFYVFASSELGWINCDRFLQEDGPLVDFKVAASGNDGASVSMIFDDQKSIVGGSKEGGIYVFHGIPANRAVRLLAIDSHAGNPVMQVLKVNTSKGNCTVKDYEPITLADLDRALCWN